GVRSDQLASRSHTDPGRCGHLSHAAVSSPVIRNPGSAFSTSHDSRSPDGEAPTLSRYSPGASGSGPTSQRTECQPGSAENTCSSSDDIIVVMISRLSFSTLTTTMPS